MDDEETIRQIRENIIADHNDLARPQILDLATRSTDRPMTLLTCASLFLTLGDEDGFQSVLKTISSNLPSDSDLLCEIAAGLIALDVPRDAFEALRNAGDSGKAVRHRAAALQALLKHQDALATIDSVSDRTDDDLVLRAQILSSLKRHDEALSVLKPMVDAGYYPACRAYVAALLKAGLEKDAQKYVRTRAKDKTADGLALMAQYQWITGNETAAGAYASKAIKVDEKHTGAMEFLGYSLAVKGAVREAKIVAGALNERDTGNAAAFRIIVLCRGK